jgi:hypothetical protein
MAHPRLVSTNKPPFGWKMFKALADGSDGPIKTWMLEMAMVALVLTATAIQAGGGWAEYVGAGAVLLTFGHVQVADRLAEAARQAERVTAPVVYCHRWAVRYLVSKEILWCVYFIAHHAWSALVGVTLFLGYPFWRRFWRRRRPLTSPSSSSSTDPWSDP